MSKPIFANIDKLQLSKDEDNEFYPSMDFSSVPRLFNRLSDYEKCIMELYYLHTKTDIQIARVLKTTVNHIYYIRHKTSEKIKFLYMIYSTTPDLDGLTIEEREVLMELYRTLKRPKSHFHMKNLIAKIPDAETRKTFNLIYNYNYLYRINKPLPKIGA